MSLTLIKAPDGTVNRYDRALWLTVPFSIAFQTVGTPAALVSLTLAARSASTTLAARSPSLTIDARSVSLTLPALSTRR